MLTLTISLQLHITIKSKDILGDKYKNISIPCLCFFLYPSSVG